MIWFVWVVLLSLSMISCSEKSAVPLNVFKQEISAMAPPQTLKVKEKATIQVKVKNIGNEPWMIKASDKRGSNKVNLGYRWLDSTGKAIVEHRAMLPNDLMPESSVILDVNVWAPSKPGDYTLRFSMVQEWVGWFDEKGADAFELKVKVK